MRAEEPFGQPLGPFEETFLKDLAGQLRANDLYGTLDAKSDEELLGGLINPKKGGASSCSPLDSAVLEKIRAFYRAIAVSLERDTGGFFQMVLEVSSEGFGRVVIYAGRLVVLDKTLRDAQAFGFSSLEKLLCDVRVATSKAKATFERFKEVASAP
jgi:probable nitrogen fixation protein